jgi:predicted permease
MKGIRRVLRLGSVNRNVEDELSYHFDRTIDELVARGATRAQAEAEARRRFGDVSYYRGELEAIDEVAARRRRWSGRLDALRQSLVYAVRSLARSPGLSLGVILAFALGIGANLTMYGIVDRLLLRPPEHIVNPEEVRRIHVSEYVPFMRDRFTGATLSYPDFRQLRTVSAFTDLAGWAPRSVTVGSGMSAVEREAVYVTGNFFALLGVRPHAGRFFGESDDRIGGPQQVVLGWSMWQRDFAGSADVLGRAIDFGYGAYEVVGVAPRGFTGVDLATVDLWLPFHVIQAQVAGTEWQEERGWQFFSAFGRLETGVEAAAAESAATMAWIAGREATSFESVEADPAVHLSSVLSAHGPNAPPEGTVARLLLIVSAIVLLIAAVNVANLLLARSLRQQRETAVRLALGISRRRLIAQIMLEGLLLAVAGGLTAMVLAVWSGDVVGRVLLPDVEWSAGVNGRIVGAAAALSLLAGAAAALFPALQATRGSVGGALRQAGAAAVSRRATRVRAGLALVQTALSVLLLVGAGLFVRSLDRVRGADMGFDPHNLIYALPRVTSDGIPPDEMAGMMERARERMARIPGVLAAGTAHTLPFHSSRSVRLRAEDVDSMPTPASGGPYVHEVSPGYLEAMDLRVIAGRTLTESDGPGSEPVALVNQSMADGLWPDGPAIGRCLYVGNGPDDERQTRCTRVIGVVEDARRMEVEKVTHFQYYIPAAQKQVGGAQRLFVLRVTAETPALLATIRQTVHDLDPRIRYVEAEPMMSRIDPQTRSWQLGAAVFSIFGLLALIVASIGLYSVLAFDVAQRTREIGVRSALGASRGAVVRLVTQQALRITALGVGVGVLGAALLADRVEPLLFDVPPRDPVTFLVVITVLHVVAALASSLPAWRAARVDPNIALRAD